jgi:hypothetical protein
MPRRRRSTLCSRRPGRSQAISSQRLCGLVRARSPEKRKARKPDAARSDETPRERAGACWHRTVLLPGLELFVSATASPLVLQAAARLLRENLGPGQK